MRVSRPGCEAAGVWLGCLFLLYYFGLSFGPYWDSWNYLAPTERFGRWIASWWTGEDVPPMTELRYYYTEEPAHPPLMVWGGSITYALFRNVLGKLGSSQLFIAMFAASWCLAVYLFLKGRYGRAPALFGLALMGGCPRFWVHAVLLNIDGLMASIYGLTLLSFLLWSQGPRGKSVIYLALTTAFLTKLQAAFLIPVLFLWVAMETRRELPPGASLARPLVSAWGNAFGLVAAAAITFFVVWPALWLDFPNGLVRYLEFITRHSNVPVLYFGKLYKGDITPPWHYPWVFTMIALPLTFTVPVLVRLFRVVVPTLLKRAAWSDRFEPILWVAALIPLLVSSMPQAPKYDGVRLLLPAYAPLVLLGAKELGAGWGWLRRSYLDGAAPMIRHALWVTAMLLLMLPTVRIYPFNLVYYSPLIGGVSGARERGFDLDYLGVYKHLLNPALCRVATPVDHLMLAGCFGLVYESDLEGWPAIPEGMRSFDFKMVREMPMKNRKMFAIISSRYSDLVHEAKLVLEKVPPIDTVEYKGERIFSLHEITPEFLEELPKLMWERNLEPLTFE